MLSLADLDSGEGLVKWREACTNAKPQGACFPALRFFTAEIAAGSTLRDALERMPSVNDEAPEWGLWAVDMFGGDMAPDFRLRLLERAPLDAAQARRLLITLPHPSTAERAYLSSFGAGDGQ